MIKNQTLAILLSLFVSIVFVLIAILILGTESWSSLGIEMAIFVVVYVFTYNILPYTPSELANADAILRRQTMKLEANQDIEDINKINQAYVRVPEVYEQIKKIITSATKTLSDVTRPGQNEDSKLMILHSALDDFDKYFYFIYQVESGEIAIDGAQKEIKDFRAEIPNIVEDFENLRKAVNAQEADAGKARGAALKMKMATLGIRRTTLKEIDKILDEGEN